MLVQSSFFSSRVHGSCERSMTLLSGHLLNHASEMLGYIAFTCTIFGKQLNGNDL